jgi:hypothetical protein
MIRRAAYLYVFIAAVLFSMIESAQVLRAWQSGLVFTGADRITIAKIVIALIAAGVGLAALFHEIQRGRSYESTATDSANKQGALLRERSDRDSSASVSGFVGWYRAVLGLILIALISIPLVLVTLGTPGGIMALGFQKWILVGLAEIPIGVGTLIVINKIAHS